MGVTFSLSGWYPLKSRTSRLRKCNPQKNLVYQQLKYQRDRLAATSYSPQPVRDPSHVRERFLKLIQTTTNPDLMVAEQNRGGARCRCRGCSSKPIFMATLNHGKVRELSFFCDRSIAVLVSSCSHANASIPLLLCCVIAIFSR